MLAWWMSGGGPVAAAGGRPPPPATFPVVVVFLRGNQKHVGSAVEFHVCFGATDALHVMAFVGFGFMLCGCLFGDFRWGAMLYIESYDYCLEPNAT